MGDDDYATVCIRVREGPTTRETMAANADLLESMGAILAEDAHVGGVETRDPTTLDGPQRPELVVYTVPAEAPRIEACARSLAADLGLDVRVKAQVHEGDAWRDRWKEFYAPQVLGAHSLLLRPSWIERRTGDPEREIVIDPGRAFGTGLHETTRLCIDALVESFERGRRFERVLDLGCGSGILGLVAARLFPTATVLAVDVDPEATATTDENVELNALEARITSLTGSVDDLAREPFDLVIANIRTEVLVPGAPAIADRVADTLLLSGILREEADAVADAYDATGLHELARDERGGWVGLRYAREKT